MAAQQLPLALSYRAGRDAGDFIISEANAEAVAWIDRWPDWPTPGLILTGGAASGKTHLAEIWREKSGGILITAADQLDEFVGHAVLDNSDRWAGKAEVALFHAINRAKEAGTSLLFCARTPPGEWGVTLPDLSSRLKALPLVTLNEPDDMLLAGLFNRALADCGLLLKPEVADYLFPRLPRTANEIVDFAKALDSFVLTQGKGATLATVKAFLANRP